MTENPGLPLAGIRVLELGHIFAAPGTTMYLADQGADVIKVEPPGGDRSRSLYALPEHPGESKPFLALNRNKRGIVVDLGKPEGGLVVRRLSQGCDVLVTNFREEALKRLAIDYATLRALNPRLIYASITGFGRKGPHADRGGADMPVQARSGIFGARRLPDGTPLSFPVPVADTGIAMLMAYNIMLALWMRNKTGRGQRLETSLLATAIAVQSPYLVWVEGDTTPLPGRPYFMAHPYRCADGEWILVTGIQEKDWRKFCEVLDLPHLVEDPRFATFDKRSKFTNELHAICEAILATRPRAEWLQRLDEAGVSAEPILAREDLLHDTQVRANNILVDVVHPRAGKATFLGIPVTLSEAPAPEIRRPSPMLGQHTEEVLQEAGYSPTELHELRSRKVIM